jgi:hypothetical protein
MESFAVSALKALSSIAFKGMDYNLKLEWLHKLSFLDLIQNYSMRFPFLDVDKNEEIQEMEDEFFQCLSE